MVRTGKRVAFADDDDREEHEPDEAVAGPSTPFVKKFKHTLDSDEEDDEQESERYNIDSEVEGEEEGEERQEADIKITPFNMKAELEEGHIDKSGMYIFDKKKGEVRDNWLDSLDNVKVYEKKRQVDSSSDDDTEAEATFDSAQCYKDLLSLMEGDETVQKAIQRIGKKSKETKAKDDKDNLMKLISSADAMISAGDMDIYGRTVSQLQYKLKEQDAVKRDFNGMETVRSHRKGTPKSAKPIEISPRMFVFSNQSEEMETGEDDGGKIQDLEFDT